MRKSTNLCGKTSDSTMENHLSLQQQNERFDDEKDFCSSPEK